MIDGLIGVAVGKNVGAAEHTWRAPATRLGCSVVVRQDGRQVRPVLDSRCKVMVLLKLQNDEGTADVNWLLDNHKLYSLVQSPS